MPVTPSLKDKGHFNHDGYVVEISASSTIAVGQYTVGRGYSFICTEYGTVREYPSVDAAKEYIVGMGHKSFGWHVVYIGGPLT